MSHTLKHGSGTNLSESEAKDVAECFRKILAIGIKEVSFNPEWHNGTGYFDQAVLADIPAPFRFTDEEGRVGVVIQLYESRVCLFQRYSDDKSIIAQCHVIDWKNRHPGKGMRDHFLVGLFQGRPGEQLVSSLMHKLQMENSR